MQLATAQALIRTLGEALHQTINAQVKMLALEKTLKEEQPQLYEKYLKKLEEAKKNPPVLLNVEALAGLQAKLVQGQD